jgi:signal transduction histidine kinase
MAQMAQVSGVLAAESFISTPFRIRGEMTGRLYLTSARRHAFKTSEISFLLQVLDHTTPVLENIRLVDRLASEAAEAERQRIALDLHDSIIQPYIGLRLGLGAIEQQLAAGCTDVTAAVKQLIQLTEVGIADLRHYAGGLRDSSDHEDGLLLAVRRFAEKFTAAAGIAVHVEAKGELLINDRLAAEVFQMVAEGLSNIRRHTTSTWARVGFGCHHDRLLLQIENAAEEVVLPFTPRSLTHRAEALGGHVYVACQESGSTRVSVDIPL